MFVFLMRFWLPDLSSGFNVVVIVVFKRNTLGRHITQNRTRTDVDATLNRQLYDFLLSFPKGCLGRN